MRQYRLFTFTKANGNVGTQLLDIEAPNKPEAWRTPGTTDWEDHGVVQVEGEKLHMMVDCFEDA